MEKMDSERLRRWKCLYCGSRQKNIVDIKNKEGVRTIKVVTCNQCGHTDIYALSALNVARVIVGGTQPTAEESEQFVHKFIEHEREISDASGVGPGNVPYNSNDR